MDAQNGEPSIIKWAKYGSILLGFIILLTSTGTLVIVATVKWAAAPIIREESRARQAGDSLIVSRLEAISAKQDIIAQALRYSFNEPQRDASLRAVQNVEPAPVHLPPQTKVPDKK